MPKSSGQGIHQSEPAILSLHYASGCVGGNVSLSQPSCSSGSQSLYPVTPMLHLFFFCMFCKPTMMELCMWLNTLKYHESWLCYFVHVAACFLFAFRVLTLTLVSRSLKNLHSNSTFQRLALPDTKVRDFALVLTLYSINGLCKHQQTSSVCFVHNSCQCRIWTWKGIAHALICIDIKGLVVRSYHPAHSLHGRG